MSTTACKRGRKPSSRTTSNVASVFGLIWGGAHLFPPVATFSKYGRPVNSSRHSRQSFTSSGMPSGASAIRMLMSLVMCFFRTIPCSCDITPTGMRCNRARTSAVSGTSTVKTSTPLGRMKKHAKPWPSKHLSAVSTTTGVNSSGVALPAASGGLSTTQILSTQSSLGSHLPSTANRIGADRPDREGTFAPAGDNRTPKSNSVLLNLSHSPSHSDRSINTIDSWMSAGGYRCGSISGWPGSGRHGKAICTSRALAKAFSWSDVAGGATGCLAANCRSTLPSGSPSSENGLMATSLLLAVMVNRYNDVRQTECTSPATTSWQRWYFSGSTRLGS
mmetsp:Transcript_59415/g.181268  ORF Transcript_59415/g.181268 Transcript_59415/m.181268 type:complete len:333 (+) Transcript_59415:659-1657(+)